MIRCENEFCIYNEGKECQLEEISISAEAVCDDCIEPEISSEIIKTAKQKTLSRIKNKN